MDVVWWRTARHGRARPLDGVGKVQVGVGHTLQRSRPQLMATLRELSSRESP